MYAELTKTEHTPTGWNWSKLHPSHAAPDPLNSNPDNGSHAPNTHTPLHTPELIATPSLMLRIWK